MSNYSMLRAVGVEGRRSAAPLLASATAATGIAVLFGHTSDWAGHWLGLSGYLWTELIVLVPLVAAVACWQAGRERRRGLQELLGTTPRPGWQPLLAGWSALVLAAILGLALTWAVGAWFVVRHESYAGGGWAWLGVTAVVPLGAAAGLGFAAGRGIPSRLTGLPLAAGLYVLIGFSAYGADSGKQWLAAYLDDSFLGRQLTPSTYLWQTLWFGALALGFLATAAVLSRPAAERSQVPRPALAVAAAALAVAGSAGYVLASGPGPERWVPDRAAEAPVCTRQGPPVCVSTVDAFLLDEIAARLQPALQRLADVPGAPVRADEVIDDQTAPADALQIEPLYAGLHGRLVKPGRIHEDPAWESLSSLFIWCPQDLDAQSSIPQSRNEQIAIASDVATAWALGMPAPADDDQSRAGIVALRGLPTAAQKVWLGDYLRATRSCDAGALAGLMSRIGIR